MSVDELFLHPAYQRRTDPAAFDDRGMKDEWQDEVYRLARALAVRKSFRKIVDFGCGSGYKLSKYFLGFDVVGYEIEPALGYLRETYPDGDWRDGSALQIESANILICADVIEHLLHPGRLLELIATTRFDFAFISTPALEILADQQRSPRFGPPDNATHVNEWTTQEFRSFVWQYLRPVKHVVVNAEQGTQLIVAAKRSGGL